MATTCGSVGVSAGFTTPALSVSIPCLFTISLPSFSFSISILIPGFSIALFLKAFLNLDICNLSVAFDIDAGLAVEPCGGRILTMVPDPSLAEQTYAVAA